MRLRRETGDFQITINSENAVNTIRKGLSAEDFVGELVNVNGTYEVVNSANDTETGAEFKTNSFTLTYTKATGVITAQEGGSGSGSGGGSEKQTYTLTLNSDMTEVTVPVADFVAFCSSIESGDPNVEFVLVNTDNDIVAKGGIYTRAFGSNYPYVVNFPALLYNLDNQYAYVSKCTIRASVSEYNNVLRFKRLATVGVAS